jgi:tetratricopeptide (TPR) repeat protein/tRNA A-37 threonylcarbamoyl transferase component Bud32
MSEETLLHQALALPPAQRGAFLDQVCAGQPALRAAVEALLRAHQAPANVLDQPPAGLPQTGPYTPPDPAVHTAGSPAPGSVFAGRFKLREKLGEGGMGVVFVADQLEPVQRRVALKIIKPGLDSARVLARFEQERQALALMDHPHIAKVLDAGVSEAGQPYFVMELIKGVPFTKYCDEARLTPRQRLELFIPVCQAVQHAHQKGVIHRDLKPSNILVGLYDGKPIPKVIDFGVAKATGPQLTEDSVYTDVGTMIGTLEYMSPEQAQLNNLDIDTRSDIYALGVILYELLTGGVPFSRKELKTAAFTEMLRILKEVEPPKPSTKLSHSGSLPSIAAVRQMEPKKLTRLVRGDLDWIVMKCLEKDRTRRYETANGLGMDLQRYLADEPVLAGPPSAAYRLRKFVRRNKGPVVAAVLVLAVLLAGILGTSWGLLWANAAREAEVEQRGLAQTNENRALDAAAKANLAQLAEARQRGLAEASAQQAKEAAATADVARKVAEAERDKAAKARDRTRQVLDDMTSEITGASLATQKELSAEQKKFLTEVLQYYREFAGEKGDDPQTCARVAHAAFRVGIIEYHLGRPEESAAAFRQARDELAPLVAAFPANPAYRQNLANNHSNLGTVLRGLGLRAEALTEYRAALALEKDLAAEFPAEPAHRQALGVTYNNLGILWVDFGKHDDAVTAYQAALNLQEKLVAEFPQVPAYRQDLARTELNMGLVLLDLGQSTRAETIVRTSLARQEKLVKDWPAVAAYRQELAGGYGPLAVVLRNLGKFDEAALAYRAALVIQEKLTLEFPGVPRYRQQLANSHDNLGQVLREAGKPGEAEVAHRAALVLRHKLASEARGVPGYRQALALSHYNLGLAQDDVGKFGEAEAAFRAALALQEKLVADFPTAHEYQQQLGRSQNHLGCVLQDQGKPGPAETAFRAALAISQKLADQFPAILQHREDLSASCTNLGILLAVVGKGEEAEAMLRSALTLREKLVADAPTVIRYQQDLGSSHNNLGLLFKQRGQRNDAEAAFRAALAIREKLVAAFPELAPYAVDLGGTCGNLGNLLALGGQPADSLEWYAKAVAELTPVVEKQPRLAQAVQVLRNTHAGRAMALAALNRHADSLPDWDKAVELTPLEQRPGLRAGRVMSQIRAGKVEAAVAEVAELTKLKGWPAGRLYDFACVYALASAKDQSKQAEYAQRAVVLLRQAVQAGYKNVPHMKKDSDLDPLRQREDFQKLLAELDKGKGG